MHSKIIRLFFLLVIGMSVFYACTFDREPVLDDENLTLSLRWVPGLETETQENMLIGLAWTLGQLGAELRQGSLNRAITWRDDTTFDLNLNEAGFSRRALRGLSVIRSGLVTSGEYESTGSVNLARFVMLTLNSSYHYYEIVGLPETLNEFRNLYDFQQKRVYVVNSSISSVDRLLEVAEARVFSEIAHIGSESGLPFSAGAFEPIEFEVLDLMPNGFLRFGIYGANGRLKSFANEEFTRAGRPAKCAWCHEQAILPFFTVNPVITMGNSLSRDAFLNLRDEQTELIREFRTALNTEVDFSDRRAHQWTEKIYEDFLEPNTDFLAREWGLSLEETQSILSGIPTHERLGIPGFYNRKDIDLLAPFAVVRVPDSGRESSEFEPNFFR